ncbi:MAG: type I methionyl aminopeptidase, partial [Victivallales bacterium]|nr:type I methionyl aminopeptidase [Victivallales bacterium]
MWQGRINIYSGADLDGVRKAAQAAAQVRKRLCDVVTPGITTAQIDMLAGEFIRDTGGKSCSLGFEGFPGQICISINEEVVHGIGTHARIVQPGDLVSLDITVRLGKYVGDCATTVCAGMPATGLAKELLETTEAAMWAGIDVAREGNQVSDIGAAVEGIANQHHFGVVRDMVGHGCGLSMHEPPEVPNYYIRGRSTPLRAGMI